MKTFETEPYVIRSQTDMWIPQPGVGTMMATGRGSRDLVLYLRTDEGWAIWDRGSNLWELPDEPVWGHRPSDLPKGLRLATFTDLILVGYPWKMRYRPNGRR